MHVAPASRELNGPHILSANDLIIHGMEGFLGAGTVADDNIIVSLRTADVSGHNFINTYMSQAASATYQGQATDAGSVTRSIIQAEFDKLLQEGGTLDKDDPENTAFTVSISWPQGIENLSMWVTEPGSPPTLSSDSLLPILFGSSGFLAEDSEAGPEVYTTYCDPLTLQEGQYDFFDGNTNVSSTFENPYTIRVVTPSGVVYEGTGVTEPNLLKAALRGIIIQRYAPDSNLFRMTVFPSE